MMRIGHVLYKVPDLEAAVERYRNDGFDVDYGRTKNPYNALAYFADGSYFELLGRTGMPSFVKRVLRLAGKGAFVDRLDTWDNADEGLVGLSLECEPEQVDDVKQILRDAGEGFFGGRSRRTDPQGRVLRFNGAMPDDMQIPFFSSCETDLSRPGFVHPNGIVGFKQISFGTTEALLPLVERLCDDDRITLFVGDGVRDLEFDYADR